MLKNNFVGKNDAGSHDDIEGTIKTWRDQLKQGVALEQEDHGCDPR